MEIEGLLRTMFDPRNNLANEVSAQLIEHFGDKVFRTLIPRNIRLAEAPSFGKPALFHDKESRGALAYLALAGEMIRRDDLPGAPGAPPALRDAGAGCLEGDGAGFLVKRSAHCPRRRVCPRRRSATGSRGFQHDG